MRKNVLLALNILNNNGYEAYLVGGAVRSYLLKTKITDFDITTNASPTVIKHLFNNYPLYSIGEKHGTVVVTIDSTKIDITTFRKDENYKDHRRPSFVEFSDDLNEDLKRRDFTINAMCLDAKGNLIDNYDGIKDLNNKLIRSIGNPETRFYEDALRILRAIRFEAKLNFKIETKTKEAMFKCKDLLSYISNERKKDELLQILATNNCQKAINDNLEIFKTFIPLNKVDKKINNFSNEYFALAYLLSKTSGYNLKELKFSKQEINLVNALVEATNTNLKKDYNFINLLSDPLAKEILKYLNELYQTNFNDRYKQLKKYIVNYESLKLNGKDLMGLGFKGQDIRKAQDELIDLIRHKLLPNNKSALIKYLSLKWYNLSYGIKRNNKL